MSTPNLKITAPSTATVLRGRPTPVPAVSLSESGGVAGETFTAVLTDATGILTATGPDVSGSGTSDLTVTGSLADVNAALATLSVSENKAGTDTITIAATDSLGDNPPLSSIDVTVTAQTLSIMAPTMLAVTRDQATPIAGVSLSEPGSVAGETFTARVIADAIGPGSGVVTASGSDVTGSGTGELMVAGSLADVNAALATLSVSESAAGTDTLDIVATDSFGDNAPISAVTVTVTAQTLSIIAPPTLSVTRDQSTPIPGVSLSEPGSIAGETFTARVIADAVGPGSGLVTATGSGVSGSSTRELTVTGSLADVNAALATLSVSESAAGTDTLDIVATDSLGDNPPLSSINVTVTAQTLSIIAPTMLTVIPGQATLIAGVSLSEPGSIAGETFMARVIADAIGPGSGLVTATGSGVSGSGTGELTVTGSLADVNAALATLSVSESAAGTDTLDIVATDSLGGNPPIFTVTVTVTARTLSIVAPTMLTVTRGQPTLIAGVSLSEPGSIAGETFTARVIADAIGPGSGLVTATGSGVSGSGTGDLMVTGSLADVNAALATLSVSESAAGTDTLDIVATDSLGGNPPIFPVTVTVTALTLSIIAPSVLTVTAGTVTAIPGVSLSEPGNAAGETFTAMLTDTTGVLTATGPGVSGSGTTDLTVTGSLDQVNAALATLSDTESTAGSDTIVLTAADSLGDSAGPDDIAVSALGPLIEAPPALALTFDQLTAIPGVSLTDTANVANETYTVTIWDAYGTLSATGDNVAGDATTTLTVNGSLTDVNAALATLFDRSDTPGSDTIAISVTDSAGIPVRPADVAVTTTSPVLPVEGVVEEDPSRVVAGFGSITDTASGQLGSETSSAAATGGLDPSVTASVSATGSNPPTSDGTAAIQVYFEILGPLLSTVPVIFSGSEMTSASAGYFGATAMFTPPGAASGTGIISATYGTGPSGYPASQTFSDKVSLSSDRVYSVTYEAEADGPSPDSGSTGAAQASVDPTIAIDPTFVQASAFTLITDNIPCFLAGSRILTERGEVPVEALAVGDRVVTLTGALEPIVWIGQGRKLVTPGRRSDATPVLVRQGALAPGVPHRHLRITKGHSLFVDSVLIPAEFLVNHCSIRWDDRAREVEFYHIELARHDVLLADGAAAETYRDDGNRELFHNTNNGWHLPPKPPCAPVLTGGPVVDAVWRRLLGRAGPATPVAMTDDPDLHLLVDGGRVDGRRRCGGVYLFPLPQGLEDVRVVSRSGVPSELGLARDPRRLGVALRRLMVWQGARLRLIEGTDPLLGPGFHAFEPDNGFRWTNGDGPLPSALFDGISGSSELELHVACTTWYPSPTSASRVVA